MDELNINNIVFLGFSESEKKQIRRYINRNNIKTLDFTVSQDIADLIGHDIATAISPNGVMLTRI